MLLTQAQAEAVVNALAQLTNAGATRLEVRFQNDKSRYAVVAGCDKVFVKETSRSTLMTVQREVFTIDEFNKAYGL